MQFALPLDFGFTYRPPQHQHLLRAMDVIDEHGDAVGTRLATQMRPLIDDDCRWCSMTSPPSKSRVRPW